MTMPTRSRTGTQVRGGWLIIAALAMAVVPLAAQEKQNQGFSFRTAVDLISRHRDGDRSRRAVRRWPARRGL